MKDASSIPNIGNVTTNRPAGEFKDDVTPGDGLGTPARKDWLSGLYYSLYAILDEAGLTPDDSEEGVTTSQVRTALLTIISDALDNRTVGNANGNIPVNNGVLNVNLRAALADIATDAINADDAADAALLDGKSAGHSSGQIPINDGAVNLNLVPEYLWNKTDSVKLLMRRTQLTILNGQTQANLNYPANFYSLVNIRWVSGDGTNLYSPSVRQNGFTVTSLNNSYVLTSVNADTVIDIFYLATL